MEYQITKTQSPDSLHIIFFLPFLDMLAVQFNARQQISIFLVIIITVILISYNMKFTFPHIL